MLALPLWMVTEHIQPTDSAQISGITPGKVLAFSTSSKLFAFMKANIGGSWKMEMAADRDGLVIVIADLHRLAVETIILDPEANGCGGEQTDLAAMMDLAEALR